jgi:hypothetical protein
VIELDKFQKANSKHQIIFNHQNFNIQTFLSFILTEFFSHSKLRFKSLFVIGCLKFEVLVNNSTLIAFATPRTLKGKSHVHFGCNDKKTFVYFPARRATLAGG